MMPIGTLSLKRARGIITRGNARDGARALATALGPECTASMGGIGILVRAAASISLPARKKGELRTPVVTEGTHQGAQQKVNMVRPPKDVPDHELLRRFQEGDEEGYVELYLRRQAEVFTYALRLAGGDRDLASDVFQETFIKVYRKAQTFREGTNVVGWLYTIVRTTFLNHRRQRTLVGLEDAAEIASSDRTLAPEFREEQSTLRERVEAAIQRLPIEIRDPFVLRECDGLSYQEISEQLNITLGAVRQRIYRAKLAMREELWDLVSDRKEEQAL